ncbi:MAG: OsmC family protein [Cyclobacteriaceae bacterium]|nr:OsmC family protein [Cyclobacteriaceae bacterium]
MSLSKTTTTKYIAEFEYEATNRTGNVVKVDMYDEPERKQAQSPMELLLSAAAACAAVDVVGMLKKKRKTVEGLSVVAEGQRREQHPRHYTDILMKFHLSSPDTSETDLAKVVALAVDKYCSVAATLRGVAEVRYESEVVS